MLFRIAPAPGPHCKGHISEEKRYGEATLILLPFGGSLWADPTGKSEDQERKPHPQCESAP